MENINIAVVDDHKLFRKGIAELVANLKSFTVLFECGNGDELKTQMSAKTKPDIILLDIRDGNQDGLATATWLKKHYPCIPIAVLAMIEKDETILLMMQLGVKCYLFKDFDPDELETSLRKVAAGELCIPEFVIKLLLSTYNKPMQTILSVREHQFVQLMSTELTYAEIADQLRISKRTVDGYRDTLFEKLNVKSRVGIVSYAIRNKLIEL
jgi:DNA-binding NarL/FixJ family response regulator